MDSDQLILLLSADWFRPFWATIGLYDERQGDSVVRCARAEVRAFLGEKRSYYEVDLRPERKAGTLERFVNCVRRSEGPEVARAVMALAAPQQTHHLLRDLFRSLVARLVGHSDLDSVLGATAAAEKLRTASDSAFPASLREALDTAFQNASGEWDSYLRERTQDPPSLLVDSAEDLQSAGAERVFLDAIKNSFDPTAQNELAKELIRQSRTVAPDYTDELTEYLAPLRAQARH